METFFKQLEGDLRRAFLQSLYSGDKKALREFKSKINSSIANLQPKEIDEDFLQKIINNPAQNKQPASHILNRSRKISGLRANPLDNDRIQKNMKMLIAAKKTAQNLNIGHTPYNLRSNLYATSYGAILTGAFSLLIPLAADISSSFNNATIAPYITCMIAGALLGGIRLARSTCQDYLQYEAKGLKLIKKSLQP